VEFALVLPVLAVILLAIMEFGYAFFVQASVAGAARVGVRSYVISYSDSKYLNDSAAQAAAVSVAKSTLPDPTRVVSATFSQSCTAGAQSTLTVTYSYHSLTGLLDSVLGSKVTITGKGSMQCGG
jgi:Flp pilus assembly protein TadG